MGINFLNPNFKLLFNNKVLLESTMGGLKGPMKILYSFVLILQLLAHPMSTDVTSHGSPYPRVLRRVLENGGYAFKVVALGASCAGKTSILQRLLKNAFNRDQKSSRAGMPISVFDGVILNK